MVLAAPAVAVPHQDAILSAAEKRPAVRVAPLPFAVGPVVAGQSLGATALTGVHVARLKETRVSPLTAVTHTK